MYRRDEYVIKEADKPGLLDGFCIYKNGKLLAEGFESFSDAYEYITYCKGLFEDKGSE
ncbi:MAG: hypothetical protein ACI35O_12875 [Bacillaceae bacterium]